MTVFVKSGNIFTDNSDVLVNPVNTRGVAGAGLAKEFKTRFPGNHMAYVDECRKMTLTTKKPYVHRMGKDFAQPIFIVNLATKGHWKYPSTMQYVKDGLTYLKDFMKNPHPRCSSVAIPALGCGLGELDFVQVEKLVHELFDKEPYSVTLYKPR